MKKSAASTTDLGRGVYKEERVAGVAGCISLRHKRTTSSTCFSGVGAVAVAPSQVNTACAHIICPHVTYAVFSLVFSGMGGGNARMFVNGVPMGGGMGGGLGGFGNLFGK